MPVCPVCQMPLDEKEAKAKTEYERTVYYFHSEEEKREFEEHPEYFAGRSGIMGMRYPLSE